MDADGCEVGHYAYDAWGNLLEAVGTNDLADLNPLRYRGYVYDRETELYYLQSRYYNPETGRFLNADSLVSTGQGLLGNNMFAYCRNNPVRRKDMSGNEDLCVNCNEDDDPLNDMGMGSHGAGGGGDSSNHTCSGSVNSGYANANKSVGGGGSNGVDFYVTPNGEAIPATQNGFNNNLSTMNNQNGKYIGRDSAGPIRIRPDEIHLENRGHTGVHSPYHTVPHFHIDRRMKGETGEWVSTYVGVKEMFR